MRLLELWKIARRDLRGSLGGFVIFFACTALGVATIASVGVLNATIERAVERDAAALLGGDISIGQPNIDLADAELRDLTPEGAQVTSNVRTNAIVYGGSGEDGQERNIAVEIKAVDDAYPLFGQLDREPMAPLADMLAPGRMLVEPSVLARLGVAVGDEVRIGSQILTISGLLLREPDRIGGYIALGPRVMMSRKTLDGLGILVPGALARYEYNMALTDSRQAGQTAERLQRDHPDAPWRVRSKADVQPQVARFTDRLATYMMMAGLTALVIGGLGIGLSVRAYLETKTDSIATLRSIGAASGDIGQIYGSQLTALALGGTVAGMVLGQLVPFVAAPLVSGLFPVALEPAIEIVPLLYAGAVGFLTVALFAWLPLARCRDVAPADLFRSGIQKGRTPARRSRYTILAGIAVALAALVVLGAPRMEIAAVFLASVIAVMLALAVAARLFLLAARSLRPVAGPRLSMALATLSQPGNGATSVVVAMGAGLAALVMVGLLQHNIERELLTQLPDRAPKLVFIDIQPDQVERFRQLVGEEPEAAILQLAPVLRARVVRIAGKPVDEVSIAENVRWTTRRDRGLTYQAREPEGTELVAGEWWPADHDGEQLVSVEEEVARGYGVGVGDTLGFNVLGRTLEARIANLRKEIDWSRGRLDFVFVMSPGLIEKAPHTTVAAIDLPADAQIRLMDRMARELPNVTPIAIGDAVERVGELLGRIALAIRVVAVVTLATGLLVLASAVVASRRQQIRRAVLLKVLGGRRRDIMNLLLLEHAGLGVVAAIVGSALGGFGAWILISPVMGLSWDLAWPVVVLTALAAIVLAAAIGAIVLRRTLTVPAATILRHS
ncbi:MAG: FtsX-like permease family protein [Geminicoccaceae bacterium]